MMIMELSTKIQKKLRKIFINHLRLGKQILKFLKMNSVIIPMVQTRFKNSCFLWRKDHIKILKMIIFYKKEKI